MNKKNLIIVITAVILSNVLTGAFFNAYYLQVPWVINFRPMVVSRTPKKPTIVPKKVTQLPKPTPSVNKDFEYAYDVVWLNESNRGNDKTGLNGYCIKKGLINEIGYAPHDNWCFVSREEQKATFILWLQNRLDHKKMPYCDTVKDCILYYTNSAYTI